ncbi:MAG: hypothetical protein QG580_35 [Patescibacteria group bacterium]|jgi:hypothetical protein|nr:hypothetical protein [Patescibacteria group bacterium]
MDKEFQTSFIPKKTIVESPKRVRSGGGIINLISFIVFVASLLSAGGAYLYRNSVESDIAEFKRSLQIAKNQFEPSLIEELQVLDKRLNAATTILNKHVAVSPIFVLLQDITLPTVRYSDFTYEIDSSTSLVNIEMKGEAKGYNFIALQADLFSDNKFIKNPIFSDFILDQTGNIDFNLSFSVDKSLISYESFIDREQPTLGDNQI